MNRGRAFFTTPETLGDYVLVDFIEHKKQLRPRPKGARPRRLTQRSVPDGTDVVHRQHFQSGNQWPFVALM